MIKVVFLNGPPGCGKDTAALALDRSLAASRFKFAQPMRDALAAFLHLDTQLYNEIMEDQPRKNNPSADFFGVVPREAQIKFSEEYAKPLFGRSIFGRLAVLDILNSRPALAVISDSGFEEEAWSVINEFGAENCLLLRIRRSGCTFKGDSRSYLELPIKTKDVYNLGTKQEFERQVETVVRGWMNAHRTRR